MGSLVRESVLALYNMLAKLARDTRGNVVMVFALSLVPILAIAGFSIDYQQTLKRKSKVQLVLDSAVLAAARIKQTDATDAAVKLSVQQFLDGQIAGLGGITCQPVNVYITPQSEEIDADISCKQDTFLVKLIGQKQIDFKVRSGSEYGIDKLDVAFMFDISGSMNSSNRLTNLKSAAKEAVDILLPVGASQDLLDSTRLSMVSYNAMVNAGEHFEAVTGVTPTRTYTENVTYEVPASGDTDQGDLPDDITLGLYTSDSDELIVDFGDDAVIVLPQDQLGDLTLVVSIPADSDFYGDDESVEFRLRGDKSRTQTENVVPYALFGDANGDYHGQSWEYGEYEVRIRVWKKDKKKGKRLFNKTFDFDIIEPTEATTSTVTKTRTITSTCVWERDGSTKFTEAAPGPGSYLAHQQAWYVQHDSESPDGYWEVGHPNRVNNSRYDGDECRAATPIELTNNRNTLNSYVTSLTAGGYTAGHLGVAWTWYLVSPEWKTVFDGDAEPLSYSEPDSAKVVILMTDGAFNTEVFPEQGNSAAQARAICDNMKQKDIQVYSVALNAPTAGKNVLSYCASGPEFYFEPETGAELRDTYKLIATSISDLRISK